MRAWTFRSRGPVAKVLQLRDDLPMPANPIGDELLIKVSHASLLPQQAHLAAIVPHFTSNPWIPETEFSGTVVKAGPEARGIQEGDPVCGIVGPGDAFKYNGVLSEYILIPRECAVAKPAKITFTKAAGIFGGGCTGLALFQRAGLLEVRQGDDGPIPVSLAAGKRVLVTGGSTGTGLVIVQIAKYLVGVDGEVVTTASPRNFESLQRLGITSIVDYTKYPKLHEYFTQKNASAPFDVIVDVVGTDMSLYEKCELYLKPDGVYVFSGAMGATHANPGESAIGALQWISNLFLQSLLMNTRSLRPTWLGGAPRKCFFNLAPPTSVNRELLRGLIEAGHVKATVDSVWMMDDALQAYDRLLHQKICGKVVVCINAP